MATNATAARGTGQGPWGLIAVALLGLGIVFASGHVQAPLLHDAAHDMRHALGFPCH